MVVTFVTTQKQSKQARDKKETKKSLLKLNKKTQQP